MTGSAVRVDGMQGITPIWPVATAVNAEGALTFHGRTAESLLDEFGSPLYLIDTDEVSARAQIFRARGGRRLHQLHHAREFRR